MNMPPQTAVAVLSSPGYEAVAKKLATELDLEITEESDDNFLFFLKYDKDILRLIPSSPHAGNGVFVDFVHGKAAYRRHQGEGRKTPLARATGFKPDHTPVIIDATAGLGQDALVLATLGARLTLVEKSPLIHALLADGMRRAELAEDTRSIVQRMTLVQADSIEFLRQLSPAERPDAIYLDPMYPHRRKHALSKKEMQAFQKLLGADQDGPRLLQIARQRARNRVAVKRPLKAACLGDESPNYQIRRPKVRFDVYLAVASDK